MFADRGAIWAKVEILRRSMAQHGMPAQNANNFGRAADFSLLEPTNADLFRRECEAAIQLPLASPVIGLLHQAHEANIAIAVIEMPMRRSHRSLFYYTESWNEYIAHVRELLDPYNVTFVDASDWIKDDSLFTDSLHLSTMGAVTLTQRIGTLLGPEAMSAHTNQRN
jgi:hypothetical protein